jgi:tRNA (guanosine-2'-O-)-methyltransferase
MKPLIGIEQKRFIRDYRRQHPAKRQISAILQSVEYPYNVGAIFRLAEGARLHELILAGITPSPPNPTIQKIGRYREGKVRWRYEKDPLVALTEMRESGIQTVALELADEALPYHEFDYAAQCCLVVGHEDHGITKATLAHCDAAVFIPMFGKGRSHNVHTALAIVAYHALLALPDTS